MLVDGLSYAHRDRIWQTIEPGNCILQPRHTQVAVSTNRGRMIGFGQRGLAMYTPCEVEHTPRKGKKPFALMKAIKINHVKAKMANYREIRRSLIERGCTICT